MALFDAYEQDAENVVLVDADGNLTEGPGFNIFVVKNGEITTPASGILEGITRRTAIDLAAELGFGLRTMSIPASVEGR